MSYFPMPAGQTVLLNNPPDWVYRMIDQINSGVSVDNNHVPNVYNELRSVRHPSSMRRHFREVLETTGSFTDFHGTWTTDLYLYNHSPERLIIIYCGVRNGGNNQPGWYDVSRNDERIQMVISVD